MGQIHLGHGCYTAATYTPSSYPEHKPAGALLAVHCLPGVRLGKGQLSPDIDVHPH